MNKKEIDKREFRGTLNCSICKRSDFSQIVLIKTNIPGINYICTPCNNSLIKLTKPTMEAKEAAKLLGINFHINK